MARARNIKPGFFKNEELAECSPWARLCFIGLWLLADRDGRLEDRPKRIKAELFAFDTCDVEPLLADLARREFIVRYEADGDRFIQISKFSAHQTPHYSEKKSVIKPPGLQEKPLHIEPPDSKSAPGVNASSRGGANPLNPDSLNPDSPKASPTGEGAPRKRAAPRVPPRPEDVAEQVWDDWLAHRRKKGATVTPTVLDGARAEAAKAGMALEAFLRVWCTRGTQGLQADWLTPEERSGAPPPSRPTAADRRLATVRGLTTHSSTDHDPRPAPPPDDTVDVVARVVG